MGFDQQLLDSYILDKGFLATTTEAVAARRVLVSSSRYNERISSLFSQVFHAPVIMIFDAVIGQRV